jgi:hypothetical protein
MFFVMIDPVLQRYFIFHFPLSSQNVCSGQDAIPPVSPSDNGQKDLARQKIHSRMLRR